MVEEKIIRRRGRITIGLRSQGGVTESILRVAGVDVIGGIGLTPISAVADMIREMKLVKTNDPVFLAKWPRPDYVMPVAPVLERIDTPVPIFHRQQAIAAAVPMKPMRLGEVGAQLNRDAESYKKRRHATDLKTRQRLMAEKRHPNRRVVAGVRAAASASSN